MRCDTLILVEEECLQLLSECRLSAVGVSELVWKQVPDSGSGDWECPTFAFVVFNSVSSVLAKRLAGKNVSEMTCFVSVGRKIINLKQMVLRCFRNKTRVWDE